MYDTITASRIDFANEVCGLVAGEWTRVRRK
jgi:hypothetical protein